MVLVWEFWENVGIQMYVGNASVATASNFGNQKCLVWLKYRNDFEVCRRRSRNEDELIVYSLILLKLARY